MRCYIFCFISTILVNGSKSSPFGTGVSSFVPHVNTHQMWVSSSVVPGWSNPVNPFTQNSSQYPPTSQVPRAPSAFTPDINLMHRTNPTETLKQFGHSQGTPSLSSMNDAFAGQISPAATGLGNIGGLMGSQFPQSIHRFSQEIPNIVANIGGHVQTLSNGNDRSPLDTVTRLSHQLPTSALDIGGNTLKSLGTFINSNDPSQPNNRQFIPGPDVFRGMPKIMSDFFHLDENDPANMLPLQMLNGNLDMNAMQGKNCPIADLLRIAFQNGYKTNSYQVPGATMNEQYPFNGHIPRSSSQTAHLPISPSHSRFGSSHNISPSGPQLNNNYAGLQSGNGISGFPTTPIQLKTGNQFAHPSAHPFIHPSVHPFAHH